MKRSSTTQFKGTNSQGNHKQRPYSMHYAPNSIHFKFSLASSQTITNSFQALERSQDDHVLHWKGNGMNSIYFIRADFAARPQTTWDYRDTKRQAVAGQVVLFLTSWTQPEILQNCVSVQEKTQSIIILSHQPESLWPFNCHHCCQCCTHLKECRNPYFIKRSHETLHKCSQNCKSIKIT